MSADELAFRVLDDDPRLLVVDLRGETEQQKWALPGSVGIPLGGLLGKEWAALLGRRHTTLVFVDDDGAQALAAALLADRQGYDDARVLRGGLREFRRTIPELEVTPPVDDAQADAHRFRASARRLLTERIAAARGNVVRPKAILKKAQGGC
jgi:rhodanese-related sulfurtransferase